MGSVKVGVTCGGFIQIPLLREHQPSWSECSHRSKIAGLSLAMVPMHYRNLELAKTMALRTLVVRKRSSSIGFDCDPKVPSISNALEPSAGLLHPLQRQKTGHKINLLTPTGNQIGLMAPQETDVTAPNSSTAKTTGDNTDKHLYRPLLSDEERECATTCGIRP